MSDPGRPSGRARKWLLFALSCGPTFLVMGLVLHLVPPEGGDAGVRTPFTVLRAMLVWFGLFAVVARVMAAPPVWAWLGSTEPVQFWRYLLPHLMPRGRARTPNDEYPDYYRLADRADYL